MALIDETPQAPGGPTLLMAPLPEAEARARIERMTAHDYDPKLDTTDIDDLLELAKRTDVNGHEPDHAEWEETWDFNAAAGKGWDIKAGRAAGDFRFEEDNHAFYREQVFRHCERMARRYRQQMVPVEMVAVTSS